AGLHALRPGEADALTIVSDAMVVSRLDLLVEAAMAKRLPGMLTDRASVARALAGMGQNYYAIGRLSAQLIRRVLADGEPVHHPRRHAGRAARPAPLCHQPKNGQGAGTHDPTVDPDPGRRDHPIMDRRAFITLVGGSILAAPLATEAQQAGRCTGSDSSEII